MRRVAHRVGELGEVGDECGVARDSPCTKQRLRLPGERPPGVVGPVGVERTGDDAVAPFGSQVGVEFEREPRIFTEPNELGDDLQRTSMCRVSVGVDRPVDVDDVGVGTDAELSTAEAAHADDGELDAVGIVTADGFDERRDVVLAHVAEAMAELFDRAYVEDRGQCQPQHLASSHGAEDLGRIVGLLVPTEHRARLLLQRRQRTGPQLGDVFEPGDRFRRAFEQGGSEA